MTGPAVCDAYDEVFDLTCQETNPEHVTHRAKGPDGTEVTWYPRSFPPEASEVDPQALETAWG